jgi:hypothetical protein
MRDWLKDNLFIVITIACIVIAVIGAIVFGCMYNASGEFDVVNWTVNPANPASPLHI